MTIRSWRIRAGVGSDHDLESSSTMKKVNAWICALRTTDRDSPSVILHKKRKSVIFVIFADLMFFELASPVTMFSVFFNLRNVFF